MFLCHNSFTDPVFRNQSSTSNSTVHIAAVDGYWMNDMSGKGYAAFNPNPGAYKVFRNVRDYGAVGECLNCTQCESLANMA